MGGVPGAVIGAALGTAVSAGSSYVSGCIRCSDSYAYFKEGFDYFLTQVFLGEWSWSETWKTTKEVFGIG